MKLEIHSLYWPNLDPRIAPAQKSVFNHIGIDINQHCERVNHYDWIDRVMQESTADVVGLLDVDCVPYSADIVHSCAEYAHTNTGLAGCAMSANHIDYRHVYVGPFFLFISRNAWNNMGRPSANPTHRSDNAQEFTRRADETNTPYKLLMPTSFQRTSVVGDVWKLGEVGQYGVGTEFEGGVYHLFESRVNANIELFVDKCNEIICNNIGK